MPARASGGGRIDVARATDVNARLLARHLGNHIPGKPTRGAEQPGAGSAIMRASSTPQARSTHVIGAAFAGMPTQPLLQPAAASASIR